MPNPAMQSLQQRIIDDYHRGRLPLPTLPDVVLRIGQLLEDEDCDHDQLGQVVQLEPALSSRLLQLVNSPYYRGAFPISNCREAIARLGLKRLHNLTTSLALAGAYRSDSPRLKGQLQDDWHQATRVAALSHVLAHLNRQGLDPDRAMLIGLLHNVGRLVLYRYLDQQPELLAELPLAQLGEGLQSRLGVLLLKSWGFDEEVRNAIAGANNWAYRHEGERADYLDLLLTARAHDRIGQANTPALPDLPAFQRLPISRLGPDASLELIREADSEIDQLLAVLRGQ